VVRAENLGVDKENTHGMHSQQGSSPVILPSPSSQPLGFLGSCLQELKLTSCLLFFFLRLKTYFKFFIVRDPFERLISAFKDKFVHNPRFEPWYRHEIAPGIIKKYRRNRTETRGIQFEDFVRYLGDPNHRWLDIQFGDHIIHWVTYAELCAPCEIKYSVIGHHETLEEDAPYILREAGIDHLVSYPTIPPGITVYNRTKVEHYFLGISKRDIRRLYARFKGDFKLFGYQKPDFLLN
jgi:carbohydrate 3-sulfotransferase 10